MATLENLPDELLDRIADFLDKKDLAETRLVNKRLDYISVTKLFERISLYAHWIHWKQENDDIYSVDTPRDVSWRYMAEDEESSSVGGVTIDDEIESNGKEIDSAEDWEDEFATDDVEILDPATEEGFQEAILSRHSVQGSRDSSVSARSDVIDENDEEPSVSDGLDEVLARPRSLEHTEEIERKLSGPGNAELWDDNEEDDEWYHSRSSQQQNIKADDEDEWYRPGMHQWETIQSPAPPQWVLDELPGPPGYDAHAFKNILQHNKLKVYVQDVHVYTCDTHCVSFIIIFFCRCSAKL